MIDAAGAIYVIGGIGDNDVYQDVWVSTDGGARPDSRRGYYRGTTGVLRENSGILPGYYGGTRGYYRGTREVPTGYLGVL